MKYYVCTKEVISITQNEERAHKNKYTEPQSFIVYLHTSSSLGMAFQPNEMI